MEQNKSYNLIPIGTIHSCFKEKFGIPRQPSLVNSPAKIEIDTLYSEDEAFRELESFSHIWVIFVFHKTEGKSWKPTVRPPRLGGNQRVGVFASRSMFRPNPIGLSVVELKSIERIAGKVILNIIGGDFLDLTPVLDIKPYLPYVDAINTAKAGYAADKPETKLDVCFSESVQLDIRKYEGKYPKLEQLITEILQLDPRPAYQKNKQMKNEFAMRLYDFDLKWRIDNKKAIVTSLTLLDKSHD